MLGRESLSQFCQQVKATAPKMDRNGYFFYVTATAKKKKISLMQPKPPRVAFAEEKRRTGFAERVYPDVSMSATPVEYGREMTQRGSSPAPRARLYSQLESYQPRYHTIRDTSDHTKKVESDVRRRKKEQRIVHPPGLVRWVLFTNTRSFALPAGCVMFLNVTFYVISFFFI